MTIKALCIIEDADRPTIAMFIGLRRAEITLTFICPHSSDSYAALTAAGFRILDIQILRRLDLNAIRLLRNELQDGGYHIMHIFSNKG